MITCNMAYRNAILSSLNGVSDSNGKKYSQMHRRSSGGRVSRAPMDIIDLIVEA